MNQINKMRKRRSNMLDSEKSFERIKNAEQKRLKIEKMSADQKTFLKNQKLISKRKHMLSKNEKQIRSRRQIERKRKLIQNLTADELKTRREKDNQRKKKFRTKLKLNKIQHKLQQKIR